MTRFHIQNIADQKVATTLNGKRVSLRFRYNPSIDRWTFDLAIDGAPMLHGRRIVAGTDLIGAFNFGIGRLFAYSPSNAEPTRDNLINGAVKFYAVSEEEVDAAMAS